MDENNYNNLAKARIERAKDLIDILYVMTKPLSMQRTIKL